MKYEHHIIYKHGCLNYLNGSDLDHMANTNGWLLISIVQVTDIKREYTFRREVKD